MNTDIKVKQDDIIYVLNENDKTAAVFDAQNAHKNVFIPYSIKNGSQEYKVTGLLKRSFSCSYKMETIEFDANSEIEIIEDQAFYYSKIKSISIPRHVKTIGSQAFNACKSLKHVTISKDSELEFIGYAAFQYSGIESIFIPHHVKIISQYTFDNCAELEQFEISSDSELKTIDRYVFSNTKIRSLKIPSKVSELKESWNFATPKITKLTIDPKNQIYKNYEEDNNIVIGKSNAESDEYDILVFVNRNAKKVIIPPFIKKIASFAFAGTKINNIYIPPIVSQIDEGAFLGCLCLKRVEIPADSKLQEIKECTFYNSSIERLSIPSSITKICVQAFQFCTIKYLDIPQDSKLQIIDNRSFDCSYLRSIVFRPNRENDYKYTFCECKKLQIIEIDDMTEGNFIEKLVMSNDSHALIMIPTRFRG